MLRKLNLIIFVKIIILNCVRVDRSPFITKGIDKYKLKAATGFLLIFAIFIYLIEVRFQCLFSEHFPIDGETVPKLNHKYFHLNY